MAPQPGGPLHILLVEDDPDHAELIRRGLAERSDRVGLTVVPDGETALGYLFRRGDWADPATSPRPSLILLDLRLPRLDGFQVLRQVKQSPGLVDIPTVILTTSEAEDDLRRAYSEHANSYLVKPVDHGRFLDLVGDVRGYWLEWNRQPGPGP